MGLKAIVFSAILGVAVALYLNVVADVPPFPSGLSGFTVFLFGSFFLPKLT